MRTKKTYSYNFVFSEDDTLSSTFAKDAEKFNPGVDFSSYIQIGLPPFIPSYTLMKVVEIYCLAALREHLNKDSLSLGTGFSIKNRHPVNTGVEIRFVISLEIIKSKLLHFDFEIFDGAKLVAWGTHRRLLKSDTA